MGTRVSAAVSSYFHLSCFFAHTVLYLVIFGLMPIKSLSHTIFYHTENRFVNHFPFKSRNVHRFFKWYTYIWRTINQLKTFQQNKDYNSAVLLIAQNPSLKQYIIGVDVINKIVEEIRNTQIYAKRKQQTIYVQDDEPISAIDGDVWIG